MRRAHGARTAGRRSRTRDFASHACATSPLRRPRSITSCSSTATWCCTRNSSRTIARIARRGQLHPGRSRAGRRAADQRADRRTPRRCPRPFTRGAGSLRRAYLLHSPRLSSMFAARGQSVGRHQELQPGLLARRPGAGQWLRRGLRRLGTRRQGAVRSPRRTRVSGARRCCSAASPATCTTRRHRASTCPAISRGWRPRAASARCAANADWIASAD